MKKIPVVIFCFLASLINAQDLNVDLTKMSQAYASAKAMELEVSIQVVEEGMPSLKKRAVIKKDHINYFYSMDDISILLNDKFTMMVNTTNEVIVYGDHQSGTKEIYDMLHQFNVEKMDSLFQQFERWEFVQTRNGLKHYQLFSTLGNFQKVDLFIRATDYTLSKVVYSTADTKTSEKNKVVINYQNTKLEPSFADNTFSEQRYIQQINGAWQPSSKYKNYELIYISE